MAAPAIASDPPTQPFDLIFTATDERISVVQLSRGTFEQTEGTASRAEGIPGTGIRKAYLLWAGLGKDADGVLLQRDSGTPVPVTADIVWDNATFGGQQTWRCCGQELTSYVADITNSGIVINGVYTYTLSDMEMTVQNWGFSLIVVYEDPTITTLNDVIIKFGSDTLHYRWDGIQGPNSDVQCVAFPAADYPRTAEFGFVVGGIEDDFRPNGLWGMAGAEPYVDPNQEGGTWTQSLGLINLPNNNPPIIGIGGATEIDGPTDGDKTGNGIDWPFSDNQGDQWDLYPRPDVPVDPGEDWACAQVESAFRPPEIAPNPQPGFPNAGRGASIGFLGLIMIIEADEQLVPSIDIEKATNGEDADTPTGPVVEIGDPITWTYVVTNTGDVTLTNVTVTDDLNGVVTCPVNELAPDATMTCTDTGVAVAGQYANMGSVAGTPPQGPPVTDEDPSHYFAAAAPAIDIEKATNGQDADSPTGPFIDVGGAVTWTYRIENTGNSDLDNVTVTDDNGTPADPSDDYTCTIGFLAVGAIDTDTCGQTGTAEEGQYGNNSDVVGTPVLNGEPTGAPNVTDEDPSHYFGAVPVIDLEKATNGEDADDPPGPTISVGDPVVWTYDVTNEGNVTLSDVTVTDNKGVAVTCPKTTLAPDETMTCRAEGTAEAGNYANIGRATGVSPSGTTVEDSDPSHYNNVPTGFESEEPEVLDWMKIYIPYILGR